MHRTIRVLICSSLLFLAVFTAASQDIWDVEFLSQVNRIRTSYGVQEVQFDSSLKSLAIYYSKICAQHGDINHDYVTDFDFSTKMTELELFGSVTELLARSDNPRTLISTVLSGFMNSTSHREGLLSPDKTMCGAAITVNNNKAFVAVYLKN